MAKKAKTVKITIGVYGERAVRNKEGETLAKKCVVAAVKKYLKGVSAHVDITMASSDRIREINKETRNIDKVTDVLSFPMLNMHEGVYEGDILKEKCMGTNEIELGDIVMCYDKICSQAQELGHSKERECAYLATHSILHLLGFDHVDEGEMKKRMRIAEEEILKPILG